MYQRFSTKSPTGTNNLCGSNIKKARLLKDHKYSQRMLADDMQRHGADLDKNMIQPHKFYNLKKQHQKKNA